MKTPSLFLLISAIGLSHSSWADELKKEPQGDIYETRHNLEMPFQPFGAFGEALGAMGAGIVAQQFWRKPATRIGAGAAGIALAADAVTRTSIVIQGKSPGFSPLIQAAAVYTGFRKRVPNYSYQPSSSYNFDDSREDRYLYRSNSGSARTSEQQKK